MKLTWLSAPVQLFRSNYIEGGPVITGEGVGEMGQEGPGLGPRLGVDGVPEVKNFNPLKRVTL